ncbi:MAG TPA: hypothetical protein P5267_02300 [Patescibacteria group bacterium]|nr:hypothetical protein [Patescibacteria group bacterium]
MTVSIPTTKNNNITPSAPEIAIPTSFDVHTMPAKFLSLHPSVSGGSHSSGFKKNILIGILLVVLVGGAMTLAAWLFLKSAKKQPPPLTNNQPAVNTAPNTLNQEATVPTSTDETLLQPLLDVSQWQTFEDPTYYYSFKYPATWLKSTVSPETIPGALFKLSLAGEPATGQIYLTIYDNPAGDAAVDWLSQKFGLEEIDLGAYKLNNHAGYQYEDITNNSFTIYVSFNGKFYALEFIKSDKATIAEVYELFLNNWQFTAPPEEIVDNEEELDTTPIVDSDNDGLTDLEELLYATDKNNADTDGDSYQDGNEVANLYNPKLAGSSKLYDSDLVKTHVDDLYHYNIIYPKSWQVQEMAGSVIFQDTNGEFVQVLVEANNKNYQDIKEWYRDYLSLDEKTVSPITVAGIESAIITSDKTRVYFIFGDNIYSLVYNSNLRQTGNFMTTFSMMIKSFKLMKTD